jgi:hypothetical protein
MGAVEIPTFLEREISKKVKEQQDFSRLFFRGYTTANIVQQSNCKWQCDSSCLLGWA